MSDPKDKPKSKLIIGLMYDKYPESVIFGLEKDFGKIEEKSDEINFDFTEYYEREFGKPLKKVFLSFQGLFDVEKLADVKLLCHELEKINSKDGRRLVNIDPGYVTKNSVILASFKEKAHRIFLRDGVYADLELVFENNNWHAFKWTFADMQDNRVKEFLSNVKEKIK